ncbi:hypothetical protein SMD44_00901 [Streptomyces alboflavus]|uniref:Uncharacterized protein n=1 Tax=Streptomyces alboflavus TaxID=67267 RepID=A0A1Z1W4Z2_9ACTN|nr:hypothetical protein [Streptomyces alboflavus]ARX81503.1 hypothetical protein SMD44_00901 [Streptomyces alboflavus]
MRFATQPRTLTSALHGALILGTVDAVLDATGAFTVALLATDDPDVTPVDWTYRVDEVLTGSAGRTFPLALPLAAPLVDLADVAPTDPALGDYLVVTGPPGAEFRYEHVQSAPAATWQVPHSLGKHPNVSIIAADGRQVFADVDHSSTDLAVITFPTPYTGRAVCS